MNLCFTFVVFTATRSVNWLYHTMPKAKKGTPILSMKRKNVQTATKKNLKKIKLETGRDEEDLDSKAVAKPMKTLIPENTGTSCKSDEHFKRSYEERIRVLRTKNVIASTDDDVFRSLCLMYEKERDEPRGQTMSKYLRDQFEFFGIQAPKRRELNKKVWQDVKKLDSSSLRTLACQTWFSPEREFQHFTVDLLEKELFSIYRDDHLEGAEYALQTLDFVRMFLASVTSWWDTVDPLATKVVGPLVGKYPEELLPLMDAWNLSDVMWLSRTSLLYQLHYGKHTDQPRLFRYCLKLAESEEFFIQKAIGWALRQQFRNRPGDVREFVTKHKRKLSALSVREALKHDK